MARPRKWKKVCAVPEINLYGPIEEAHRSSETIIMTIEEYETIRLIDQERLTQEESAQMMHVARGTIQRLYTDARAKLAESLINGHVIKIEGGDYLLSSEEERRQGCGHCRRNRCGRRVIE